MRDWRPPRWGVVTALVLVLIAGLAVAWDDNWLKSPIERRVAVERTPSHPPMTTLLLMLRALKNSTQI